MREFKANFKVDTLELDAKVTCYLLFLASDALDPD